MKPSLNHFSFQRKAVRGRLRTTTDPFLLDYLAGIQKRKMKMKKIMFTLAMVAVAVVAQASNVKWGLASGHWGLPPDLLLHEALISIDFSSCCALRLEEPAGPFGH